MTGLRDTCALSIVDYINYCQVYGWIPKPFTEDEFNDTTNEFAQEAKTKLGTRFDPDYIGITCDGEVSK